MTTPTSCVPSPLCSVGFRETIFASLFYELGRGGCSLILLLRGTSQVIELEDANATLNLGVRALLIKCSRIRRLSLGFDAWHRFGASNVVINDEGMSYIGQYGHNLQIITFDNVRGSTDAGLAFIAFGCVKLRKLELRCCPFGDASKSVPAALK